MKDETLISAHPIDAALRDACESGSRGWGFASPDSDYDVRFIEAATSPRWTGIHHFIVSELDTAATQVVVDLSRPDTTRDAFLAETA